MKNISIDIIIVSFNTKKLLRDCIKSITDEDWRYHYQIVVVDNGSLDGSIQMVQQEFSQVKLIEAKVNLGFAKGNNLGIKESEADYCLLLNSDTIVKPDSLDLLVDFARESDWGIVSCRLENANFSFQPNAGDLPTGWSILNWLTGADDLLRHLGFLAPSFHQNDQRYYFGDRAVGWVSGSVLLISRAAIEKLNGFDERLFMYCEDVDLCWRARKKGFKVGWTNRGSIIHLGGKSSTNPSLSQWRGEFRGLFYLARKHYNLGVALMIKGLFYLFILARMVAFLAVGKIGHSRTYLKVLISI